MALNWNLKKVKNFKRKVYRTIKEGERGYSPDEKQYRLRQIPERIIFYTLNTGISDITEKNYLQFYNRVNLLELQHGVSYFRITPKGKRKPIYTTLKDVKNMIGLSTNASRKTTSRFLKDNNIDL